MHTKAHVLPEVVWILDIGSKVITEVLLVVVTYAYLVYNVADIFALHESHEVHRRSLILQDDLQIIDDTHALQDVRCIRACDTSVLKLHSLRAARGVPILSPAPISPYLACTRHMFNNK